MEAEASQRKPSSGPRKVRRISRACDFCHQRSIRCRASDESPERCQNCVDFDQPCTYNRPQRRSKRADPPLNTVHETHASALEDQSLIDSLVTIYFEIVHPIFPFHHWPTFMNRLAAQEHHTNKAFFANLMALCALSAARLRDGASPRQVRADPTKFANAAKDSIPRELTAARGLDNMRACAIMAIYRVQDGKRDEMHEYLGMYISLVTMDGLYDEARWPKDLEYIEIEERRRLFWSMYTFEVFTSTIWGSLIRLREAHCRVSYPSEVDDEEMGTTSPSSDCWMHGWNFITELYRVLEHILDTYPRNKNPEGFFLTELFYKNKPTQDTVLQELLVLHERLPQRFKNMQPNSDLSDKYNFQAANIAATFQLVRIVLCTTHQDNVEGKIQACDEFLHSFSKVPPVFLKAISAPLLYQIAGIGTVLGSVIEGPISFEAYYKVKETLLGMADLLDVLEIGHSHVIGSSTPLRSHIARIDEYMRGRAPMAVDQNVPQLEANATGLTTHALPMRSAQHDYTAGQEYDQNYEVQLPPEILEEMPWPFLHDGFNM